MPESVSTTTNFTLAVDDLIEEALDMISVEGAQNVLRDGYSVYETRSARRSLNLLLIDLSNREYPLGHLEQRELQLQPGVSEYQLGEDLLGILDLNYRSPDNIDTPVNNQSPFDFFNIADKQVESNKPSVYCFDRTTTPPTMRVWPVPSSTNPTPGKITYWAIRRHKDVTKSYQLVDLNYRYLPALSAGLAYFMGLKKPTFT